MLSKLALVPFFAVALLTGCGAQNASDTESSGSGITIGGRALFGPVSGATVSVYAVNSDGSLSSTALTTATTDSTGGYTLTLSSPPTGPIAVKMTGGSYKEEGSGATVSLSNKTYTSLLSSVSGGSSFSAALGPLPDMAYQKFAAQVQAGLGGTTTAEAINNSNYQVSQAFGLSDVVGVIPANTYGTIPNDATGQYALVLAALSKAAQTAGTDSTAMAAAYAKALAHNGNLSSIGSQSVTNSSGTTVSITPPSMSSLASTVAAIGMGTAPLSGVTPPTGFVAPTFNPTPPSTAPTDYVPGAPNTGVPATKGLASVWTVSNGAWAIDWTNAVTTNTPFTIKITFATGAQCSCGVTISSATSVGGSCSVSTACSFVNGTGSDPGCATSSNFGVCANGGYAINGVSLAFNMGATYH